MYARQRRQNDQGFNLLPVCEDNRPAGVWGGGWETILDSSFAMTAFDGGLLRVSSPAESPAGKYSAGCI